MERPPLVIMSRMVAKRLPVDDCFTAVVSSSHENGAVILVVNLLDAALDRAGGRRRFTVSAWRENFKTIRLRLCAEGSGTTAYLQGGMPLLTLAAELGLVSPRKRQGSRMRPIRCERAERTL
jgi:hypothetical protein